MPKSRTTIFTVIREYFADNNWTGNSWELSAVISSHGSLNSAEEQVGVCEQAFVDIGDTGEYRFTIHTNTYYD